MITQKSTITTEVIFSDDKKQRYLLRKEWDSKKRKAMVLMINPSSAGEISIDFTTMYVINNLVNLDYGSVEILNLFSSMNIQLNSDLNNTQVTDTNNDNQIVSSASKVNDIIIAWGKSGGMYKKIKERQKQVMKLLEPFKEKILTIVDSNGISGFHPLAPQIRFQWNLKNFDLDTQTQASNSPIKEQAQSDPTLQEKAGIKAKGNKPKAKKRGK